LKTKQVIDSVVAGGKRNAVGGCARGKQGCNQWTIAGKPIPCSARADLEHPRNASSTLFLIGPDGYIGLIANTESASQVKDYLRKCTRK
jgi:hypothetical protein